MTDHEVVHEIDGSPDVVAVDLKDPFGRQVGVLFVNFSQNTPVFSTEHYLTRYSPSLQRLLEAPPGGVTTLSPSDNLTFKSKP